LKRWIPDIMALAAVSLVGYGLWMLSPATAYIVGGSAMLLIAVLLVKPKTGGSHDS